MKVGKNGISTIVAIVIFSVIAVALIASLAKVFTSNNGPLPNLPPVLQPQLNTGTYTATQLFDPGKKIEAANFNSVDEFNNFVKSNAASNNYNLYYMRGAMAQDMAVSAPSSAPAMAETAVKSASSGGSGSADFSPTNNQIASVDEADIIKTDGNYIYTVSGNTLFIILAYPGEDAEVVSKITLNQSPTGLFINGEHLAVFGNYYNLDFFRKTGFTPRQGMTYFNIYDISDKKNPELVKEYKFEGNYFQARMVGDYVYFVVTSTPEYRTDFPTPLIFEGTVKTAMPVSDIYYYNIPYQSPQFATINAIKLTDPNDQITSKAIAVEQGQNMYMSEKNIYITYTEYINEYDLQRKIVVELMQDKLTDADKQLIEKIKQTDDDVLSPAEKEQKIMNIVESYVNYLSPDEQKAFEEETQKRLKEKMNEYEYFEYTVINKISFDKDNIEIIANGKVPGHIMNQFSLDEHDNFLRIATTIGQRWSSYDSKTTESSNQVITLDSDLKIIDSLKDMAKGEQIYSTRFIGDKLYIVTFRQVDPFFVIDLSNPNDIKELGQLKIPGFSTYLHPYDDHTIIGIGRDATDNGRAQGLKISLFDVSDFQNPKEIAKFVTNEQYAQSTAEYEHKAFLFSKEKDLLVIPAYSYEYDYMTGGKQNYNGAMVFRITKDSIELRGIIDHSQGTQQYYGTMVERSLYINELLYTKSPSLLRINKIEDLSKVKNIDLIDSGTSPYPVY